MIEIDRHSNTTLLFFHFLSISFFFYFWLSETYSLISIQLFYDFDVLQTFSKYRPDRGSNPPNEGTSDQKPSALSVEPHSHSRITKFENTYRTTNKTGVLSYYNSASPNPTGAPRRAFGPIGAVVQWSSTLVPMPETKVRFPLTVVRLASEQTFARVNPCHVRGIG